MSIIVHPFTAGADGKPAYTADEYRRTNTVWLSPVDTTNTTAASTGVSGVRNEVTGPICTISGSTVTVKDHAGIVYPFRGGSPYTYFVQDESVTLESTTQSYKIALVITDPSAGIGSTAGATIQALPSTTPDSNINGMVLAQVVQGVVSDVAPRLLSGTIIQTQTLTALQQIKTTDGQKGRIATTGDTYTFLNGAWVKDKAAEPDLPFTGPTSLLNVSNCKVVGYKYGRVVSLSANYTSLASDNGTIHVMGYLPKGWWPVVDQYVYTTEGSDYYGARRFDILDNGRVSVQNMYGSLGDYSMVLSYTYLCQ